MSSSLKPSVCQSTPASKPFDYKDLPTPPELILKKTKKKTPLVFSKCNLFKSIYKYVKHNKKACWTFTCSMCLDSLVIILVWLCAAFLGVGVGWDFKLPVIWKKKRKEKKKPVTHPNHWEMRPALFNWTFESWKITVWCRHFVLEGKTCCVILVECTMLKCTLVHYFRDTSSNNHHLFVY